MKNSYVARILFFEFVSLGVFYFIACLANKFFPVELGNNTAKDVYDKVFDLNLTICIGLFLAFCMNYIGKYNRAVMQVLFLVIINCIGITFSPIFMALFFPDLNASKMSLLCAVILTGWSIYLATVFVQTSRKS